MYFEFENEEPQFTKSTSNGNFPTSVNVDPSLSMERSSSSPTSPLAQRKHLFGSSLSSSLSSTSSLSNQSSTPVKNAPFLSPLGLPSSSPISAQRHRRYSIHSSPTPVTLDSLQDNPNVTNCDLALITKKKLLQLNSKALSEEYPDPDVKLKQDYCHRNNKDLRRGVLLASMQRSLSVSSDDLSMSPSGSKLAELNESIDTEDLPMEVVSNNSKILFANNKSISPPISVDEMMTDCFASPYDLKKSPISRIRARRSLTASCYTPMENQNNCMNSATTCTSTTSMAGNRNGVNHCRSYIKKLNVNPLNVLNNSHGVGNGNYYSYSSSVAPNLTVTMSADTPLKKRLHSSSPSKYTSPYHTISNSVCKDFNLIFANASNPMSPDWDATFKRLKVMHCNPEAALLDPNRESNQVDQTDHSQLINGSLAMPQFPPNIVHPEHELNELTQDFHRLKTPFT